MEIFNLQPIRVTNYIFNEEELPKAEKNFNSEIGFGFTGKKQDTANILITEFQLIYNVGEDDDLLLSYNSYCQFEFKSVGYDADIKTLINFLSDFYAHTEAFFQQYGFTTLRELEEKIDFKRDLESSALIAIDSLRYNKMYQY